MSVKVSIDNLEETVLKLAQNAAEKMVRKDFKKLHYPGESVLISAQVIEVDSEEVAILGTEIDVKQGDNFPKFTSDIAVAWKYNYNEIKTSWKFKT